MAPNLLKLYIRRFRRDPLSWALIIVLFCLLYLLYQLPEGQPYSKHLASEYSNHSADSYDTIDKPAGYQDSELTVPVYRDGVIGNYEPSRKLRSGFKRPGDHGVPYSVDGTVDTQMSIYGMNMAASDRIPMDRIVPDIRHAECPYWHYPEKLPTASVVIVFHNEGFSTLLRTVHSVLIRSPRRHLREVLLVDDFSDRAPLKRKLEKYIEENFGTFQYDFTRPTNAESLQGERLDEKSGKVRLVRNKERAGLIRSRARGAREALGEAIVFLDAHCEVNFNWLVPLLAPIAQDRKTLTAPVIDGIDASTFEYRPIYGARTHFMGIWEWGMLYKETEIDMKAHLEKHRFSEPYESATHAGGLFAIGRQFFLELGGYDEGLLVWGGENFELSFKVWQCGGRQLWVPCSRVGHIYRPFMPYSFGSLASARKGPLVLTNYKRVIEVWFDDAQKEYFYTREPMAQYYDVGDISGMLALKERLQCRSFDWFLGTAVGSMVLKDFPRLPPNVAWGDVRSADTHGQCLDATGSHPPAEIKLYGCHRSGGNQMFRLNAKGQLGFGERCIDGNTSGLKVVICPMGAVNGPWSYHNSTQQMLYRGRYCLTARDKTVVLDTCDETIPANQKWIWRPIPPRA